MLESLESRHAQVILLQETQHFIYDDGSSAGLAWPMLREQRVSNGSGPNTATAVKQQLMKFVRATKMAERCTLVLFQGTLILVRLHPTKHTERVEMQGQQFELLSEANKGVN